jgi:hypothetical protein
VLLKSDGNWEYLSNDRFATSEDGTRVKLKDDGQWEFIGNTPMVAKQQVRTQSLDVQLHQVVTEYSKQKVGKNTRHSSQTVFYLDVNVSRYGKEVPAKLSHHNLIEVTDSRGNQYPVLSVSPAPKQLQPGKSYRLAVRVDGSPSGQFAVGIKQLHMTIQRAVFATERDITFSRRVDELDKKRLNRPL